MNKIQITREAWQVLWRTFYPSRSKDRPVRLADGRYEIDVDDQVKARLDSLGPDYSASIIELCKGGHS